MACILNTVMACILNTVNLSTDSNLCINLLLRFLPARRYASAGNSDINVSVRPGRNSL